MPALEYDDEFRGGWGRVREPPVSAVQPCEGWGLADSTPATPSWGLADSTPATPSIIKRLVRTRRLSSQSPCQQLTGSSLHAILGLYPNAPLDQLAETIQKFDPGFVAEHAADLRDVRDAVADIA